MIHLYCFRNAQQCYNFDPFQSCKKKIRIGSGDRKKTLRLGVHESDELSIILLPYFPLNDVIKQNILLFSRFCSLFSVYARNNVHFLLLYSNTIVWKPEKKNQSLSALQNPIEKRWFNSSNETEFWIHYLLFNLIEFFNIVHRKIHQKSSVSKVCPTTIELSLKSSTVWCFHHRLLK